MTIWGINALTHGSSLAVFEGSDLKLTSWDVCTSDRLDPKIIRQHIASGGPDTIFWYENPWLKKTRQVYAGQYDTACDMSLLPKKYLKEAGLGYAKLRYTPHHGSHAAAGYFTSPFNHAAIVVLDAIGEWDCASIWEARHGEIKKVWTARYPNSLGLFYSAFAKLLGLTPIRDEHLLQQMARQGDPTKHRRSVGNYFKVGPVELDYNFHRGALDWTTPFVNLQDQCDLAAAVQERFEIEVAAVMTKARRLTSSDCLVYMGGCAMNSDANKREVEPRFKYIWSLPNPGDASSAIGSVLYHTRHRVWDYKWDDIKHIAIRV